MGARTPIGRADLEAGETLEVELRRHCLLTAGAVLRRPGHLAAGASMAILHGLPVLTVAATVLDLACRDPRSGLMAADAALHEHLLTVRELANAVAAAPARRGVRRARRCWRWLTNALNRRWNR